MEVVRVKQKAKRPLVFLQEKFQEETGERLPKWVIKNLIKKYGFEKVIKYLRELYFKDKKNPIGYLTEAIKNTWPIEPKYLKQYEVEKKEQLREAKILRVDRQFKYGRDYMENKRRQELQRQAELLNE